MVDTANESSDRLLSDASPPSNVASFVGDALHVVRCGEAQHARTAAVERSGGSSVLWRNTMRRL